VSVVIPPFSAAEDAPAEHSARVLRPVMEQRARWLVTTIKFSPFGITHRLCTRIAPSAARCTSTLTNCAHRTIWIPSRPRTHRRRPHGLFETPTKLGPTPCASYTELRKR
jgi:hypothetical protein